MKLFYKQANMTLQSSSLKNRSFTTRFSILVLLTISLCFRNVLHAQTAPPIEWQNTIGGNSNDGLYDMQQTTDGGYILGGYSASGISGDKTQAGFGGNDYWVIKLNSLGSIEWQNTIGGNSDDNAASIQQTTDGGYIVGGFSNSGISGNKTEACFGGYDYWIVKLSQEGSIEWQKTIGGSSNDYLQSLQQTSDGGYILGGWSISGISGDKTEADVGDYDYWVVKLNASGNIEWQNTIGGDKYDEFHTLEQTTDGGYILAGLSRSGISGDKTDPNLGLWDYWVVKLNGDGSIKWQKTIGGSLDDILYTVQQTTDGGYLLGGWSDSNISGDKTENSLGSHDYWIVKIDSIGNIEWQNTIGGKGYEVLCSARQTADGGYIIGGYSPSGISGDKTEASFGGYDYWVVKLDASGHIEWDKTIGGNSDDDLIRVLQTSDSGYILGGFSYSGISGNKTEANIGGSDFWVVKLEPEVQSCLSPSNLSVTNITSTSAQLNWNIEGTPELFRISYHAENGPIQIKRVAGTASSVTLSNLIPNTAYQWSVTGICGPELASSTMSGNRFQTSSNKEEQSANGIGSESFRLYPNPSSGSFTINLQTGDQVTTSATIQILNAFAQTIYTNVTTIDNGVLQKEIQLNDAAPGIYLVKVMTCNRVYTLQMNLQK